MHTYSMCDLCAARLRCSSPIRWLRLLTAGMWHPHPERLHHSHERNLLELYAASLITPGLVLKPGSCNHKPNQKAENVALACSKHELLTVGVICNFSTETLVGPERRAEPLLGRTQPSYQVWTHKYFTVAPLGRSKQESFFLCEGPFTQESSPRPSTPSHALPCLSRNHRPRLQANQSSSHVPLLHPRQRTNERLDAAGQQREGPRG